MNLDEIEARANAATPGPWDVERETGLISTDDGCAVASIHPHGNVRTVIHTGERYSHSDAAFIAAARTDVHALIARVRELEEECKEWQDAWDGVERYGIHTKGTCYLADLLGMRDHKMTADYVAHAAVARVRELEAERDQALDDYQDMGQKMNDECAKLEKERDEARKEAAAWALRVVELARANEQLAQERADFKLRAEDEIANNVVNLNAHRNQVERLKKLETDIRDHVSHTGGNGLAALEDLAEEVRKTWVRVDDECIELRAERERTRIFGSRKFAELRAADVEQMREYGLSYEGVRKVLREYNDGEISFGKLMDLIRAAARAMAEPTATYSEGETLLRAQAAEAQQFAKQMMDERDEALANYKTACIANALCDRQRAEAERERDEERMRTRVLEQTLAETQADLERSLACWEEAGMEGRSAHSVMLGLAEERDRYKGAYDSIRARIDAIELDMARKPA